MASRTASSRPVPAKVSQYEDVRTLHATCQACHHWHNKVEMLWPRDNNTHVDIRCKNCRHKMFGIGRTSTHSSLVSQMTIEAGQVDPNVHRGPTQVCSNEFPVLAALVNSSTTTASLGHARVGIAMTDNSTQTEPISPFLSISDELASTTLPLQTNSPAPPVETPISTRTSAKCVQACESDASTSVDSAVYLAAQPVQRTMNALEHFETTLVSGSSGKDRISETLARLPGCTSNVLLPPVQTIELKAAEAEMLSTGGRCSDTKTPRKISRRQKVSHSIIKKLAWSLGCDVDIRTRHKQRAVRLADSAQREGFRDLVQDRLPGQSQIQMTQKNVIPSVTNERVVPQIAANVQSHSRPALRGSAEDFGLNNTQSDSVGPRFPNQTTTDAAEKEAPRDNIQKIRRAKSALAKQRTVCECTTACDCRTQNHSDPEPSSPMDLSNVPGSPILDRRYGRQVEFQHLGQNFESDQGEVSSHPDILRRGSGISQATTVFSRDQPASIDITTPEDAFSVLNQSGADSSESQERSLSAIESARSDQGNDSGDSVLTYRRILQTQQRERPWGF